MVKKKPEAGVRPIIKGMLPSEIDEVMEARRLAEEAKSEVEPEPELTPEPEPVKEE